jgi:hypothetical protein
LGPKDYHLFVLGALSFAAAYFGRQARRQRWCNWARLHITGMGTSYVLLLIAFYVDNGKQLPDWKELPHFTYWLLPAIIGVPLIIRTLLYESAGSWRDAIGGPSRNSTANADRITLGQMKTPYIPHTFGEDVDRKLRSRRGWLTAGVASSILWPSFDVCVEYAGDEYFLRGSERDGKPSPPGISIACDGTGGADAAIAKIFRFTSILSWFLSGYVDVSGYMWGSHPILYGARTVYSSMGIAGAKSFNCNHMPIIEDDNVRKALAFWREGKRLNEVHDSYAFLSFYKVIESQFRDGKNRGRWIAANIDKLTDRAAKRVAELRAARFDVANHLFESGRCAVAHASLEGEIIDPDIPADRKRLSADLVIIEELARIYIRDELWRPRLTFPLSDA